MSNNPQPVMGMDAHHEWTLHGPYLDKSLLRNYIWYNKRSKAVFIAEEAL